MRVCDTKKYEDIINLKHHISKVHHQMSNEARAAQFASFAALTGYEDEVKEVARLTERKIEIEDEIKANINEILKEIQREIKEMPEIVVTYFIPDKKKKGGRYETIQGRVKKIDEYNQVIVMENTCVIKIKELIEIEKV